MKIINILSLLLITTFLNTKAQEVFTHTGKITYEKKVNWARAMRDMGFSGESEKTYLTSNWDLFFDDIRSLFKYKIVKDVEEPRGFISFSESENEIFMDYAKNKRIFRKSIITDSYIFNDTIPKPKWKIVNEARTIAGFECRKALAKINDSVYVVAFYTDKILNQGGPEGFSGLPGMILGLAIPRYNTTWFATKVEFSTPQPNDFVVSTKGKSAENEKEFSKLVELFKRAASKDKPLTPDKIKQLLYGYILDPSQFR